VVVNILSAYNKQNKYNKYKKEKEDRRQKYRNLNRPRDIKDKLNILE
jgi:hypothetical protein